MKMGGLMMSVCDFLPYENSLDSENLSLIHI